LRLTAAFVAHEARLARRSHRYRWTVLLYLALASAPAVLLLFHHRAGLMAFGPGTFIDYLAFVQPFSMVLLLLVLATDGVVREQRQGSWTVLTLTGMSNAGYLLRRWVALLAVTLPWMVVPLLATAVCATTVGVAPMDLVPFLPGWLVRTVPSALATAALALGLGTVGGGLFSGAALFALGTLVVSPLIDRCLVPLGMAWRGFGEWLGFPDFQVVAFTLSQAPTGRFVRILPTQDIPMDPLLAAEYLAARGAIACGGSFLLLATAALFLRRTVADTPPWRVSPRHPLRSFLGVLNGLRQRFRPEPRPALADYGLLLAGVAILALAVGWKVERHHHFLALAQARYAAEVAEAPAPTALGLVFTTVRVEGRLEPSGRVATRVAMEIENSGGEAPGEHLAFTLDPALAIRSLSASRGEAAIRLRAWDRLAVALSPPLAPGEARRLDFVLEGEPRDTEFRVLGLGGEAFASRFQRHAEARFSWDLADLTHSMAVPVVGPRQVVLRPEQFLPVPRYTPWTLTPPGENRQATGMAVREEGNPAMVRMELDLEGPPGLHLVSACGGVAAPGERLRESCAAVVNQFQVLGAELAVLRQGTLRFAVLRLHRSAAAFHEPVIERVAALLGDAWPGETALPPVTLLEWTQPPLPASASGKLWSDRGMPLEYRPLESFGNLVLLQDTDLMRRQPIPPETLLGQVLAGQLLMRRPLVADHRGALRFLLDHLVKRRLGLAMTEMAVIGPQQNPGAPTVQLWPRERWDLGGEVRARAVLNYLLNLVGEAPFYATVEKFLRRGEEGFAEPGTLHELIALLEAEHGLDLTAFWNDFLEGQALPDPRLEGVRFRRGSGGRWRVTGTVRNQGTGTVRCPVLLTTDLSPQETQLVIPDGGSVAFTLETPYRPQAVVLDPQGECLRFQGLAAGDGLRVEFVE